MHEQLKVNIYDSTLLILVSTQINEHALLVMDIDTKK
jgi:hypothetical protein